MDRFRNFLAHGLIFFIPFQKWEPLGTPYANITFLFFFGYFLASLSNWRFNFQLSSVKRFLWPIFLLGALMLVMTIKNDFKNATNTYSEVRQLLMQVVFLILLANDLKRNPELEISMLRAFVFGMILMSIFYIFGVGRETSEGRTTLFGINSNALAFWFALSILIVLRFREEKLIKSSQQYILLLFTPLFLYIVAYTGSRGGLAFLFLGTLLYFLLLPDYFNRKLPQLLGVFLLIFIAGYTILQVDIVNKRIQEQVKDATYGGRLPIWEASYDVINRNIVLGVGASGFENHIVKKFGKLWSPHNEYLLVLAYTGLVGIFLFSIFLFRLAVSSYRLVVWKKTSFYLVVFLSLLAYMYTSGGFLVSFTLWFIFTLIASGDNQRHISQMPKARLVNRRSFKTKKVGFDPR